MTFVYVNVACKDTDEAQKIADALLAKKLVACAKITGLISSDYWWKGKIEKATEVMLILETHESRCGLIEEEMKKLHSYDTFVMTGVPMSFVSKDARLWLQDSLNLLGGSNATD